MSNSVVIDFYDIKNNKGLLNELIRQKKSQKHYSTKESEVEKNIKDFNQAKEKIKRRFIDSEKTNDNTIPFAAMTIFKDKNE